MLHTVENERLRICVNEHGAELMNVTDRRTGYEYLWQGDPAVWTGRSPILFPIVGRLLNDAYRLNGETYTLAKHGFARKSDWELLCKNGNSLTFRLRENEETLKSYPYAFDLTVSFTLQGNALTVLHTVQNKNADTMYFSLGAHPGFNCEIGDSLVFDEAETLSTEKIDLVRSLRLPEPVPVLRDANEIVITKDIFNEDALIFKGVRSSHLTLFAHGGKQKIRFLLAGSPYLGIWAKPGAPYVCIEPWWGVNDDARERADISQKDEIRALPAGAAFSCAWSAEFSDLTLDSGV